IAEGPGRCRGRIARRHQRHAHGAGRHPPQQILRTYPTPRNLTVWVVLDVGDHGNRWSDYHRAWIPKGGFLSNRIIGDRPANLDRSWAKRRPLLGQAWAETYKP